MRNRLLLVVSVVGILLGVLVLFRPEAKHDRTWERESSVWTDVDVDTQSFTLRNLRDWKWDTNGVVSEDYRSQTYYFDNLEQVWFIVEPFGSWDGVAHTFFSFEFKDNEALAFSIEARKEEGEEFSALQGLFNTYELYYLWGTEEDLLARRAVYLKNDVFMYPLQISDDGGKRLLRDLLVRTKELQAKPEFYNTFSSNCTNNLATHANRVKPGTIDWFELAKVFTGYSDELLYKEGLIPNKESFESVQSKYDVTDEVVRLYGEDRMDERLREYLYRN